MNQRELKYILDIEQVIQELELILKEANSDFSIFQSNIILIRATERNLEIVGEALKNWLTVNPNQQISHSKEIIGLRNILAHAYDNVDTELLWGILVNNIPILKREIIAIKS